MPTSIPLLLLLSACFHRSPAPPVDPHSASAPPAWVMEVLPALQSHDVATALHVLDETLDRDDLTPQERTLALWYRAAARAWAGDSQGEILDLRAFVSASAQVQLRGDAVGAQLQHRVELAQLAVLADDARLDPNIGATPARAVPVTLASDEQFFLDRLSCGPNDKGVYAPVDQQLIHLGEVPLDQVTLECSADHSQRAIFFDLTDWFALLRFGLGAAPPPDGLTEEGARELIRIDQEQNQQD